MKILARLGYSPDEKGVSLYQYQYNEFLSTASPETQEKPWKLGRDLWRQVLSIAFDISKDQMMRMNINNNKNNNKKSGFSSSSQGAEELSIIDARNIMFQVAQKMMEPTILESIERQVANATSTSSSSSRDDQQQHTLMAIKYNRF